MLKLSTRPFPCVTSDQLWRNEAVVVSGSGRYGKDTTHIIHRTAGSRRVVAALRRSASGTMVRAAIHGLLASWHVAPWRFSWDAAAA